MLVALSFVQILSASEGNILEDESAILVITEAKSLGNEISSKQKIAEETEVQIEAARTAYKPCGDYTAILFFCISGIIMDIYPLLCLLMYTLVTYSYSYDYIISA